MAEQEQPSGQQPSGQQPNGQQPNGQQPNGRKRRPSGEDGPEQPRPERGRHPAPPAAEPNESFRPIVGERHLRRFDALSSRPRPRAQVALVLITSNGAPKLFRSEQRPTAGELLWSGSGTLYEVDTGLHHTRMEIDLPSQGDAFPFHAEADVQWRVQDPVLVVRDAVRDVRVHLRPPLGHLLAPITRRCSAREVERAENAARTALGAVDIGAAYGLRTRVFLRLTMSETTVKQYAALDDVDHRIVLEQRLQQLRELQESHNDKLLRARVSTYLTFIQAGDVKRFALQLAQNPDEVPAVVQRISEERIEDRKQVTDFVTRLLESGAIERWEIDDQVRTALEWLKNTTNRVIQPTDVSQAVPGRDGEALPRADLPAAALPGHAVAAEPPPGPDR